MAHFKSYLLAFLDALGISVNSMLAWVGINSLGAAIGIDHLHTWWDWACFIADVARVSIMSLLSISFLMFRFYVEWRKFKKDHPDKDAK